VTKFDTFKDKMTIYSSFYCSVVVSSSINRTNPNFCVVQFDKQVHATRINSQSYPFEYCYNARLDAE
jgi:hypothetical protein